MIGMRRSQITYLRCMPGCQNTGSAPVSAVLDTDLLDRVTAPLRGIQLREHCEVGGGTPVEVGYRVGVVLPRSSAPPECPSRAAVLLRGPLLRGGSAVPQPECGQRQARECY